MPCIVFLSTQPLRYNGRYRKLARALRGAGHKVEALQLERNGNLTSAWKSEVEWQSGLTRLIRTHQSGSSRLSGLIGYRVSRYHLARELSRINSDIILPIDSTALDAVASCRTKAKILFDACEAFDSVAGNYKGKSSYAGRVLRRSAARVDAMLVVNSDLKKYYKNTYSRLPEGKVVSNSPDWTSEIPFFGNTMNSPLRQRIGAKQNDTVLLFHGNLSPHRGLERLIDSANAFSETIHLVFMGYGQLRPELEAKASTQDRVHILPTVPNDRLPEWLVGADYGLIPYDSGPINHMICTPNKLYEFAFSGVPVLASSLPSLKKIIEKSGIGKIIEPICDGEGISRVLNKISVTDKKNLNRACAQFKISESWDDSRAVLLDTVKHLLTH